MSDLFETEEEISHPLRVLYRKVGIPDWKWFKWERVGNSNDSIYTGCVPNGVISKGPRQGMPRFKGGTREGKYVVTHDEAMAEKARWEAETGKCGECLGKGEVWSGWSAAEGNRYRPCHVCRKARQS